MSEHPWSWTVQTSFPSRRDAHLPCLKDILQQLTQLGWAGQDLFGVEMALQESLSNAARHGNQLDEAKLVHVACKASPDRFWLRVRDEGPGFDPNHVPDCTADENLQCPGGRGITLIRAYMTNVEFNPCGNSVTMEKIRSKDGPGEGGRGKAEGGR